MSLSAHEMQEKIYGRRGLLFWMRRHDKDTEEAEANERPTRPWRVLAEHGDGSNPRRYILQGYLLST